MMTPVPAINDLPSFAAKRDYFNALNADLGHYDNSNDICTPMECVKEMVDSVPANFWRKQNLKILDSCCGNGNFHAYIMDKTPLKNLFFNDINQRRIEHVQKCFGGGANIAEKDFLQFLPFKKYDLIISNPPYAFFSGGKRAAKNHNLSRAFIHKALDLVNPGGYLLFIAPDNWMSFSDRNTLPEKMSRGQFVKINIHGAKKWFPGVGSSFTWFLWQNAPNRNPVSVENHYRICAKEKIMLPEGAGFIPLFLSPEVISIMKKTVMGGKPNIAVETTSDLHRTTKSALLSPQPLATHPHRIIHTPTQTVWSMRPHKYQKGWKVFISLTNKYGTFVDNCGMTQSIAFVRCGGKREALALKAELDDNIYWFINELTRYGNFNNIRVLQKFPRLCDISLTAKEKKLVERFAAEFRCTQS
ncbi:MAG: methyltransferase [Betaproteobacteria bacterium]|nr:methyltransferase [Betaproteobacteria bacterium]